jgi:hypothetical protein
MAQYIIHRTGQKGNETIGISQETAKLLANIYIVLESKGIILKRKA